MKYYVLLLIILIFSCQKNNEIIEKPDQILYTDIEDTTLTSIDSLVYIGNDAGGDCYEVFPTESEISLNIDINNDGTNDFKITHSHWYGSYYNSPSYWCDVYRNFKTEIEGYNDNKILVLYTTCLMFPEKVKVGDTIDGKLRYTEPPNPGWEWSNEANIYLYSSTGMCSGYPESEYIGVRISQNNTFHYGWLRIYSDNKEFTVKEYAVNLTPDNCILVGQTQ